MATIAGIVDRVMSVVVGLVGVLFREVLERVRHRRRYRVAIWVGLTAAAVVLAGCSGSGEPASDSDTGGAASAQETPPPSPRLRMSPAPTGKISWTTHPVLVARHATITSVRLTSGHDSLAGTLRSGDTRWRANTSLIPDTRYRAEVQLQGTDGAVATRRLAFKSAPAAKQLTMTAYPGPGATYGVGQTVKVTFNRPVPDRAAVEKHMSVTTSREHIVGGWHWFSDQEAHFRPKHFWPADTRVTVHVDLQDVYAGDGVWGDRDHDWSWHVGESHISYVGARSHRFRVTVNGHQVADWPTGMGKPGFETRSGTYNVIMKTPVTQMTSCSIGLSCKPSSPNYYDLKVRHDVRLTDSGTFAHAAPWDDEMGTANTSHGCIHLSTDHAKRFYDLSVPGDIVIVTGTHRPASTTDPGMADWAIPWSQWEN